ncbi:serine/threonine-protein kinase [Bradymonas sediminis]|uniref:Protein kinase domain-containing protein n=1 Tax=Bradymonas sediminis TaxID=1548548 RepID=A0A2Z4FL98_9DELT|nr:serine/threonine-protein kinase [Bradymonas sediminis]AWV89682.1 hypothetical protein DN745_10155 [Bradymonas sediminis]TDP76577.1 serine/threonine protein kinase [Bradymonas sediminis]
MTMASNAQHAPGDEYLGKTLDERYRLDAVIGAGAIGKIYAGTQLAVDRKVAIKLLHPSVRGRELGTERFLREAKAVARLSDASCLTLFDFGLDESLNCFYMVTEFVEGLTLAEQRASRALEVDQIYYVLFQVTTALAHAHECGILHRDLKPENIMLVRSPQSEEGSFETVKVLDFGLARIREEAGTSGEAEPAGSLVAPATPRVDEHTPEPFRLTHFGELNGTPAYMSPEQCRGDLDLTPACDYYALGVLAYELFEGHLPYRAEGVAQLLSMHLEEPIPPMTCADIPTEVEDMIYRLMGKNPEFRLQSSQEVLGVLRAHMSRERVEDLSLTSLDRFRAPTPTPMSAVAQSGAETLADFDPLETPIPRAAIIEPSVRVEEANPEESSPDDEDEFEPAQEGSGRIALALLVGFMVVGGLVWAISGSSTGGDGAEVAEHLERASDQSAAVSEAAAQGGEGGVIAADNAPAIRAVDAQGADVGAAADVLGDADDDVNSDAAASPSSEPAPRVESRPAKARPRKLELTY